MKDKFEDWIQEFSKLKEGWNSLPEFHRGWFGIQIKNYKDEAVEECNTLHQQAMKDIIKQLEKENPYPSDIFKNKMGVFGKKVWENCIINLKEIIDQQNENNH